MILTLMRFHPWSEVPEFTVVSSICHPHLWTNMKDLAVIDDDTAVVDHVFVDDRP